MRRALVERMTDRLISDAVAAAGNNDEVRGVFNDLFEVFAGGGHAKLLAWLAIEQAQQPPPDPSRQTRFNELINTCAAQLPQEDFHSVRNLVTLAVSAAIGLGVAGQPLMALVGLDSEDQAQFPDWVASRLGIDSGDNSKPTSS